MSGQAFFKSSTRSMNLNVGSLTPLQLSKTFKIPIDDIMLQDEDKNLIYVEDNSFSPPLAANKVYEVMDSTKDNQQLTVRAFLNLMPSEEQKVAIVQKVVQNEVIKSLNKPAVALSNIIPACHCIEYLLITGATASDYSLISSSVTEFQYLKSPKSMKVSVSHVAQAMSKLILKNKSDLDQINLKMGFVSEQFRYILPAIWTKNKEMVARHATQMDSATKVCVDKSADCAERCEGVLNMVHELVTGLIGAQTDIQNQDETLSQNIAQLAEKVKLVQAKHDKRKIEMNEQQKKFDNAYEEQKEQQKRGGSMAKSFGAGWLDILSFGKAKARSGMDSAYKNATDNKKDEKDLLMKFRDEFSEVEDELTNLKISCKKDELEKEGLAGIIESIAETIKRIEALNITVQNMQQYFQSVNNLIKVSFKDNAELFIEQARNQNPTALDNEQMMKAVVDVYMIFSVVQTFATIFSIAASHESVQSSLTRGTSYFGLTHNEARVKQLELDLKDTDDEREELEGRIISELQNQTNRSNENIRLFIDNCIQVAQSIEK